MHAVFKLQEILLTVFYRDRIVDKIPVAHNIHDEIEDRREYCNHNPSNQMPHRLICTCDRQDD